METNTLNALVTGAIWRAEQLEARGLSSTPKAWAEVSSLEEELAKALPVSYAEGRIARRGAVRAALKAEDYARAAVLADMYTADETSPPSLKAEIRNILEDEERALAIRYRYAARHHNLREARDIARSFSEEGAFRLAAPQAA